MPLGLPLNMLANGLFTCQYLLLIILANGLLHVLAAWGILAILYSVALVDDDLLVQRIAWPAFQICSSTI